LVRYDIFSISSLKVVASLISGIEEIESKCAAWKEDENNKVLAVDFIDSVRVYFELIFWDTLCSDSVVQ